MNNEIMSRVLQALDLAQNLLENSGHHDTILAAYSELRTELTDTINSTQCVWPMCKSEEFQNKLATEVNHELIGYVTGNYVSVEHGLNLEEISYILYGHMEPGTMKYLLDKFQSKLHEKNI